MRAPGFHPDVPEGDYHADRASVSVSGLKLILKAPALYRWRLDHPEHKDVFDFGTAAHAKVLGVGAEVVVVDADTWQTKAAKEARETARAEGKVALLAKDAKRVDEMADVLSSHTTAMRLLSDGRPEVSAYAPDEPTGLLRRCRFDWLGAGILTDYKSCADASPDGFANAVARYGYDMQAAYYLDIARDLGHPAEAFAFIAQEKEAPYLVEVYDLDAEFLARGRRRYRAGLERLRDCLATDMWPGHSGRDFTTLTAPRWALYTEETA